MKKMVSGLGIALLFSILSACSSSDEAKLWINNVQKVHQNLETLQVTYEEGNDEKRHETQRKYDVVHQKGEVDSGIQGMIYYIDEGKPFLHAPAMEDEEQIKKELEFVERVMKELAANSVDPFQPYTLFDPEFIERVKVKKEDEQVKLTYHLNEKTFKRIFSQLIERSGLKKEDVVITTFEQYGLDVLIDAKSHEMISSTLIEKYHFKITGQEQEVNRTTKTFDYRYNEPLQIQIPEDAYTPTES